MMMSIEEIFDLVAPITGIGFLLGCIPLLMGIGIQVVINILKKI